MNDEIRIAPHPNKTINETELFMKYKSSYTSAFIDLSVHAFLTCSSFYSIWYFRNSWLSVFTIPILGTLLHRCFVMFHDCCHNSYTPNKTINYVLSSIYGITTFTSPNWILDHHTHHLTNGNIENVYNFKFNELLYWNKTQFTQFDLVSRIVFGFFHTPLIFFTVFPIMYFFIIQRFIYVIKKYKYKGKISKSFRGILYDHIANNIGGFILCYVLYQNGILYHYIISSYIGYLINFLLFFNQHIYNPPYIVGNKEWTQRDSGLKGSSFIQIPRFLKYFTMGIEYHHIHHMNAKIPGYNLQKYHEEVVSKSNMFDNIVKLSMTDCYNNLWLVLYDDDNKRYITFAEADEEIRKDKHI
jgi:omega-6 fatty acid desaturase (delta-12 desaturase)